MIIDNIGEKHLMDNRSKRLLCYKAIAHAKFGKLGREERRRLGVCCENIVLHAFSNEIGEACVGYRHTSAG